MIRNTIITFLKRFTLNTLKIFSISLFVFSGFFSCVSIPSSVVRNAFPRVDVRPPVDAFGLVLSEYVIKPGKCLESEKKEVCEEAIKDLPIITKSGMGSGLLVKAKTQTILLTAAHVCSPDAPPTYEADGVKITIESHPVSINVRTSTRELIEAEIIKIDRDEDLCALRLAKIYTEPVQWSDKQPEVGDKVFAISAPYGINHPTMTLIFSGFYSGYIGGIHHYTIPTRPGSSGSVVLDKNYMGVGMLNAAYLKMESIGIGTGYEKIRNFLNSI